MDNSEIMIFQKKSRLAEFTIRGTILKHVTCYNYLGLIISAFGKFNTAIKDLTDKSSLQQAYKKTTVQIQLTRLTVAENQTHSFFQI